MARYASCENGQRPLRPVSPGRIILRELQARAWQQRDLAEVMGRPEQAISEIIRGKKQITYETARELASAFGTSADFWMNLEANYRLQLAERGGEEGDIRRRALIYQRVPYRELVRRGWIDDRDTLPEQEREVCKFLGIASLDEQPRLAIAARRSAHGTPEQAAQVAWARRVEFLAGQQSIGAYSRDALDAAIPDLLLYSQREEDTARVPHAVLALGVHLVLVPHLPHTYLDGAALYRDHHPVVALTLRYDRLDNFWFTLMHELGHIVLGHPGVYLDSLFGPNASSTVREQEANACAEGWLIDREEYQRFRECQDLSSAAVREFAAGLGRHPSIVAGRIQHETGNYRRYSRLHASVRPYIEDWLDTASPRQR